VNGAEPLTGEILAALLWDLPALRAGSQGAIAFADAFGPPRWEPPPPNTGPLAVAAKTVQLHRSGESTDALALMATLSEQPETGLLGLCLTGWAAPPREASAALHEAAGLIEAASADFETQARLFAKIAGLALDAHDGGLYERSVRACLRVAPEGSAIAWRTAIEALGRVSRSMSRPCCPRAAALTPSPPCRGRGVR
jgi:hypothetical protein